jgi:hypothetical protein
MLETDGLPQISHEGTSETTLSLEEEEDEGYLQPVAAEDNEHALQAEEENTPDTIEQDSGAEDPAVQAEEDELSLQSKDT